ncbi:hypothetical protein ANN_03296, partial [Periplaneta americana]
LQQVNHDLCKAFVAAGISSWKLENLTLKEILEKYTKESATGVDQLRRRLPTNPKLRSDVDVNNLVSSINTIFLKSPSRIQTFKAYHNKMGNMDFSSTVVYYASNLTSVRKVSALEDEPSSTTAAIRELLGFTEGKCGATGTGRGFERHFRKELYEISNWLCGCDVVNRFYCWTCLLFSTKKTVWNQQGYGDLNHLNTAVKKHAKQEQSFRGHEESSESINKGNYVEFLLASAEFDSPLKEHLLTSTVFRGTSASIQNDLINSVADVLRDEIYNEIQNTDFVAIMLDETSDISNKSQLSTVFRYFSVSQKKVVERFLGFRDVSADRTAAALFDHVNEIIEQYNCEEKLVAQTYDGAAVMSSHLNGLQSKVLEKYPKALFTHCYAHVMNLVLQQSLECNKDLKKKEHLLLTSGKTPKEETFVWSVALYGAETWTLRRSEEKRLEAFEMWIWRRMERVKWTDRIRNEAVLERVVKKE